MSLFDRFAIDAKTTRASVPHQEVEEGDGPLEASDPECGLVVYPPKT